jgi:alcohol dehydrogenase class IV
VHEGTHSCQHGTILVFQFPQIHYGFVMQQMDLHHAFLSQRLPCLRFGHGVRNELIERCQKLGNRGVLVTGAHSLKKNALGAELLNALQHSEMHWAQIEVGSEPSPQQVDQWVQELQAFNAEFVLAIGGGSVLDVAKALAGLLQPGNSILDHLEGVGPERPYCGPALPWIAVPTTAGTGSEATMNAVLSQHTQGDVPGYKKSFRHPDLIAHTALLDPDLLSEWSTRVAEQALDAFTQLLESYVSTRASRWTDVLAWEGLSTFKVWLDAVLTAENERQRNQAHRQHVAELMWAAYLSGVTLAQAGLGSVHGLAAPLGAFSPIPHGAACGTLVAAATELNIHALRARSSNPIALNKYAAVAGLFLPEYAGELAHDLLTHWIEQLHRATARLGIQRLHNYGVDTQDFALIVAHSRGSSMKTNPIELQDEELLTLLQARA